MAKVVAIDGQTVITDETVTRDNPNKPGESVTESVRVEFSRKGLLDTGKKDQNGNAIREVIHLSEVLPGDEIKSSGPNKFVVIREVETVHEAALRGYQGRRGPVRSDPDFSPSYPPLNPSVTESELNSDEEEQEFKEANKPSTRYNRPGHR